ncbi:nucleoside triphosphate pyrophosphohydrolase ham1 [Xylographa carneopallida]|nr:nucleoside triphosphate pyrophosphohydrolase ham1 [Xylographa carneopallida]
MTPKAINFITSNRNKLVEVEAILGPIVELHSTSLDLVEIQGTIEEISVDKCRRAALAIDGPVLVEDTCLCFNALKELPGPYMEEQMARLCPPEEKLILVGHILHFLTMKLVNLVLTLAGWDAIFEYEGKTYAEMDKTEKNKISHRFLALEKLRRWLEK